MSKYNTVKDWAEKLGCSNTAIRTFLCREEFGKYRNPFNYFQTKNSKEVEKLLRFFIFKEEQ